MSDNLPQNESATGDRKSVVVSETVTDGVRLRVHGLPTTSGSMDENLHLATAQESVPSRKPLGLRSAADGESPAAPGSRAILQCSRENFHAIMAAPPSSIRVAANDVPVVVVVLSHGVHKDGGLAQKVMEFVGRGQQNDAGSDNGVGAAAQKSNAVIVLVGGRLIPTAVRPRGVTPRSVVPKKAQGLKSKTFQRA